MRLIRKKEEGGERKLNKVEEACERRRRRKKRLEIGMAEKKRRLQELETWNVGKVEGERVAGIRNVECRQGRGREGRPNGGDYVN